MCLSHSRGAALTASPSTSQPSSSSSTASSSSAPSTTTTTLPPTTTVTVCAGDEECVCHIVEEEWDWEWHNILYGGLAGLGVMLILLLICQLFMRKRKGSSFDLEMSDYVR